MTEKKQGDFFSDPLEPEPPDREGSSTSLPTSFKDKVLGKTSRPSQTRDLVKDGSMSLELVEGNRLLPKFSIAPTKYEELCGPWKKCLIIKLLGKNIGFLTMKDRLRASWKLEGDFDIIDVSNGFFLVNFDLNADKEKIMHGGPWMIFDHYLTVRQWDPEFSALESKVDKTLVWVRFPGLGMVYYNESVLLTIAAANGRPIKVDLNTLNMNRGRFARVCVEIDLNSPVVGKFCLNDRWHKVEYEGLHLLCTGCGCYGHLIRECPKTVFESTKKHEDGFENTQKEEEIHKASNQIETQPISKTEGNSKAQSSIPIDVHGEWMIVTRKKRNTPQERKILGQGKIHKGSSFGNPSKNGIISDKEKEKNLQFKDLTTQEGKSSVKYIGGSAKNDRKRSRLDSNKNPNPKAIIPRGSETPLAKTIGLGLNPFLEGPRSLADGSKTTHDITSLGGPRYLLQFEKPSQVESWSDDSSNGSLSPKETHEGMHIDTLPSSQRNDTTFRVMDTDMT
ncbi:uncharacterized protein LOC109812068 [Cajanus cajan]|uniref:uncharacterized protein LOC109812068 n=1 Tax=Cajanus cajan TaxID=3821 RepID=UPI00098D9923|nr:uncharacterized protein LOC109812068 [Cajanus cajan]